MQPSIANHTQTHHCKQTHHHHNTDTTKSTKNQTNPHTDTPQNQPKIKYTHTVTHQQRQRAALLPPYGYGFVLGRRLDWVSMLVEEIGVFGSIGTNLCGSVLVADRCLWIDACECEGERERWFQPRGGEGEASVIHGGDGVFKDGEKERVFRWVLKGIWDR